MDGEDKEVAVKGDPGAEAGRCRRHERGGETWPWGYAAPDHRQKQDRGAARLDAARGALQCAGRTRTGGRTRDGEGTRALGRGCEVRGCGLGAITAGKLGGCPASRRRSIRLLLPCRHSNRPRGASSAREHPGASRTRRALLEDTCAGIRRTRAWKPPAGCCRRVEVFGVRGRAELPRGATRVPREYAPRPLEVACRVLYLAEGSSGSHDAGNSFS